MRQTMNRTAPILLTLVALSLGGCGSTIGDYCDAWVACEGGNDKDRDACVAITEGSRNATDAYGCKDEWEARMDCRKKYSSCDDSDPADPDLDDGDACDSERNKLDACVEAASINEP